MTYDIIAMFGTSDQSCWLAEACKILLLLLLLQVVLHTPQRGLLLLITRESMV